jgi:hypothetical protein
VGHPGNHGALFAIARLETKAHPFERAGQKPDLVPPCCWGRSLPRTPPS